MLAAALGVSAGACRKTEKNAAPDALPAPGPAYADYSKDAEAVALCRAIMPCAPGQKDMCATGGERRSPASYRAPGVRIERLYCPYTKMGEDFVVGVPEDGSPHLRGLELFLRVQGSPAERASAAAELVLDGRQLVGGGSCAPHVDPSGALSFCVGGEPGYVCHPPYVDASGTLRTCDRSDLVARCVTASSGSVACSMHDPRRALTACTRSFGGGPVVAEEMFTEEGSQGAIAMGVNVIASDHAIGGSSTGAPVQPLRAAGWTVRQARCSPTGAYPYRYAHWGESRGGELAFGGDLFPKLDSVVMRAALAVDLALNESERSTYLLLDPIGGPDAMVVPGSRRCMLPPGPRERDGVLELFTSRGGARGPEIRHCRVNMAAARGLCGAVTPETFC